MASNKLKRRKKQEAELNTDLVVAIQDLPEPIKEVTRGGWRPGAGRLPKAIRYSAITNAVDQLQAANIYKIAHKAIDLALAGDQAMLKYCLDRWFGKANSISTDYSPPGGGHRDAINSAVGLFKDLTFPAIQSIKSIILKDLQQQGKVDDSITLDDISMPEAADVPVADDADESDATE